MFPPAQKHLRCFSLVCILVITGGVSGHDSATVGRIPKGTSYRGSAFIWVHILGLSKLAFVDTPPNRHLRKK
eukprot:7199478-Heterocapsa_arctica.AAC.1